MARCLPHCREKKWMAGAGASVTETRVTFQPATGRWPRVSRQKYPATVSAQRASPPTLQNGGKLEVAQQMAGHESARTTGLYDRRNDSVALDEVERVAY